MTTIDSTAYGFACFGDRELLVPADLGDSYGPGAWDEMATHYGPIISELNEANEELDVLRATLTDTGIEDIDNMDDATVWEYVAWIIAGDLHEGTQTVETLKTVNDDARPTTELHTGEGDSVTLKWSLWVDEDEPSPCVEEDVYELEVFAWIEPDMFELEWNAALGRLRSISEAGCASGCYMPAVTYYEARETMGQHGDAVIEFLTDWNGNIPTLQDCDSSYSKWCCAVVSNAVELWADQALGAWGCLR